jgi:hypothetical protein
MTHAHYHATFSRFLDRYAYPSRLTASYHRAWARMCSHKLPRYMRSEKVKTRIFIRHRQVRAHIT